MKILATSLLFAFATMYWPQIAQSHPTPCNQNNDTMCLEGVRKQFMATTFWFGDGYEARCPPEARKDFYCTNKCTFKTVASRVLRHDNFSADTIEQFLRIRYNVPGGMYIACGHQFEVEPLYSTKDIDNTHTLYDDMWSYNHRPSITFEPTNGEWYTLVGYDAGHLLLGGVWVNIQTADVSSGQELYPPMGPKNPMWRLRNPFVYVMFRQTQGEITNRAEQKTKIRSDIAKYKGDYFLDDFIRSNHLEGPMAVGFIIVKTDPFGIQHYVDKNIFNNCPFLVSTKTDLIPAMKNMGYRFDGNNSYSDYRVTFMTDLEMDIKLTYVSPEAHLTACCKHKKFDMYEVRVDPLAEDPISAVYTRHPPQVQLLPMEIRQTDFAIGKIYSLLMLDITEAIEGVDDPNILLQWQVVNIPGGRVKDGNTVLHYMPPLPMYRENSTYNTYAFFLLRQEVVLDHTSIWSYTGTDCHARWKARCKFNLVSYMENLNLKMAGATLIKSKQDEFSRGVAYGAVDPTDVPRTMSEWHERDTIRQMRENHNFTTDTKNWMDMMPMMEEEQACKDYPGYGNPCPHDCH